MAAAFKECAPGATLAYVMTDGAGLPLAMSDLVVATRAAGLLDATITTGHAFGGDHEAVSVYSALAVARRAEALLAGTGADASLRREFSELCRDLEMASRLEEIRTHMPING